MRVWRYCLWVTKHKLVQVNNACSSKAQNTYQVSYIKMNLCLLVGLTNCVLYIECLAINIFQWSADGAVSTYSWRRVGRAEGCVWVHVYITRHMCCTNRYISIYYLCRKWFKRQLWYKGCDEIHTQVYDQLVMALCFRC